MRVKYCLALAALVFVCSAAPALAAVIEYTDLAAFNAAVSGSTTYNFNSVVVPPPPQQLFSRPYHRWRRHI